MAIYYQDGQQMHLGDSVRIKRFLRSSITATIDYLSGESLPNRELETPESGLETFAIHTIDRSIVAWDRLPGTRLGSKFCLLSRGAPCDPILPDAEML